MLNSDSRKLSRCLSVGRAHDALVKFRKRDWALQAEGQFFATCCMTVRSQACLGQRFPKIIGLMYRRQNKTRGTEAGKGCPG
jgi:hypothetical protein